MCSNGLVGQRTLASTTLRGVGLDARNVVTHLRRYCQTPQPAWTGFSSLIPLASQTRAWLSRGNELVGLIALIGLALKRQLARQKLSSPQLVGQAMLQSLVIGAGFLGFGHAAALYSQH